MCYVYGHIAEKIDRLCISYVSDFGSFKSTLLNEADVRILLVSSSSGGTTFAILAVGAQLKQSSMIRYMLLPAVES